MQRLRIVLGLAVLFLSAANPLSAEILKVVKLTDLRGNPSFQICSTEDVRKIEAELSEEAKVFQSVAETVKADWNRTNSEAVFPSARLSARTIKIVNTTVDREEAVALLSKAKLNEERSLVKDKREDEEALRARAGGWGRAHRAAVAGEKRSVLEDQAKDELADRAERILRKKLSAAVGHDVPFYGTPPEEPKKARRNKKK